MAEVGKALNDPAYALNIVAGPPFPELVAQQPGSGLIVGNQVAKTPTRFILKKAHMSGDDFRIFDATHTKRVVANSHHFGKNPYGGMDPLGVSNSIQAHENRNGEWESLCDISGYQGMPSLRVRPKALSMHGRQLVQSHDGSRTFFNIGKESRLKDLALRPNLAVAKGDSDDVVYKIHPDLMGRTFQVVNEREELVCFVRKSTKALIMEAALGSGSEMMIDVAPGVDWTAMLAIVLSVYQVGQHWAKDALGNFVLNPLQDSFVSGTLEATGLDSVAQSTGQTMDQGMHLLRKVQDIYKMFQ